MSSKILNKAFFEMSAKAISKSLNKLNLQPVIKCQCEHLLDERFPSELINKKCNDCGGVL